MRPYTFQAIKKARYETDTVFEECTIDLDTITSITFSQTADNKTSLRINCSSRFDTNLYFEMDAKEDGLAILEPLKAAWLPKNG